MKTSNSHLRLHDISTKCGVAGLSLLFLATIEIFAAEPLYVNLKNRKFISQPDSLIASTELTRNTPVVEPGDHVIYAPEDIWSEIEEPVYFNISTFDSIPSLTYFNVREPKETKINDLKAHYFRISAGIVTYGKYLVKTKMRKFAFDTFLSDIFIRTNRRYIRPKNYPIYSALFRPEEMWLVRYQNGKIKLLYHYINYNFE